MYLVVTVKAGRESNIFFRHPWIFSGALETLPDNIKNGDFVYVADKKGKILATGAYSAHSSIAIRIFSFVEERIGRNWFVKKIDSAKKRRELMGYGAKTDTTGYRAVYGESDGVPGLIVDRYENVLVFQLTIPALDRHREDIVSALSEVFKPASIMERSDTQGRKDEGLETVKELQFGDEPFCVEFHENGHRFIADVLEGQKTGFFLDQKDLREMVGRLGEGKNVLNLFSYSGATGIYAIKGGALRVHNVDGSDAALGLCKVNAGLNNIPEDKFTEQSIDVFQYLSPKEEPSWDMIVMDPPALIKSAKDVEEGKKAYHFLNRAAMRLLKDGGIFVTSSCSRYLPVEDMSFILRRASAQAEVNLHTLAVVRQSADHPVSVYFPESEYLKSFVFQVRR